MIELGGNFSHLSIKMNLYYASITLFAVIVIIEASNVFQEFEDIIVSEALDKDISIENLMSKFMYGI